MRLIAVYHVAAVAGGSGRRGRCGRGSPVGVAGAGQRVITVSEHARGDLVTVSACPAAKIGVIPEAADPRFHRPVAPRTGPGRRRGMAPSAYVFYVGGWEGRKNIPFLVRRSREANLEDVSSCWPAVAARRRSRYASWRSLRPRGSGPTARLGRGRRPPGALRRGACVREPERLRGVRPPALRGDGRRLPGARREGDGAPRGARRRGARRSGWTTPPSWSTCSAELRWILAIATTYRAAPGSARPISPGRARPNGRWTFTSRPSISGWAGHGWGLRQKIKI